MQINQIGKLGVTSAELAEQVKKSGWTSSHLFILPEIRPKNNPPPNNLKAHLFDLADQDRQCLARIRERLQLNSSALAVRLAIRELAHRLEEGDKKTLSKESHT